MTAFDDSFLPDPLVQAYRETEYRVFGGHPMMIRIGELSPGLDVLLNQSRFSSAAFITACNPFSEQMSNEENDRRQESLRTDLETLGLPVIEGNGIHPAGEWPGEPSFLVPGIDRDVAIDLGRRYQQNAIVWCEAGGVAELVFLKEIPVIDNQPTIRVLAAVIEQNSAWLLGKRPQDKRHGGLWEFPGGKLEPRETASQAAQRELKKEMALTVISVGECLFTAQDPGSPYLIEFIEVSVTGDPRNLEHEAIGWFGLGEMATLELAPSDRRFFEFLRDRHD